MKDFSKLAVMASMTDYGLADKEARGVFAGETALPRRLDAAAASLAKFAVRRGISLEGSPQEIAAKLANANAAAPAEPMGASAAANDLSM